MDSFPLDDFAIYVTPAESEDASEMPHASEAANVRNEDISPIKFAGELIWGLYKLSALQRCGLSLLKG